MPPYIYKGKLLLCMVGENVTLHFCAKQLTTLIILTTSLRKLFTATLNYLLGIH